MIYRGEVNEQKDCRAIVGSLPHVFILQTTTKRGWHRTRVINQDLAQRYSFPYTHVFPNRQLLTIVLLCF